MVGNSIIRLTPPSFVLILPVAAASGALVDADASGCPSVARAASDFPTSAVPTDLLQ